MPINKENRYKSNPYVNVYIAFFVDYLHVAPHYLQFIDVIVAIYSTFLLCSYHSKNSFYVLHIDDNNNNKYGF